MDSDRCPNQADVDYVISEENGQRIENLSGAEISPLKSSLKRSTPECNSERSTPREPGTPNGTSMVTQSSCKNNPDMNYSNRQNSYRRGSDTPCSPNQPIQKRPNDRYNESSPAPKRTNKYEEQPGTTRSPNDGNRRNQPMHLRGKPYVAGSGPTMQKSKENSEDKQIARKPYNNKGSPGPSYSGANSPSHRSNTRENDQSNRNLYKGGNSSGRTDTYEHELQRRNAQRTATDPGQLIHSRIKEDPNESGVHSSDHLVHVHSMQNRQNNKTPYSGANSPIIAVHKIADSYEMDEEHTRKLHSGSHSPERHLLTNKENQPTSRSPVSYPGSRTHSNTNSGAHSPALKKKSHSNEVVASQSSSPRRNIKKSNDNVSITSKTSNRFHEASHAKSPNLSSAAMSPNKTHSHSTINKGTHNSEHSQIVKTPHSDRHIHVESSTSGATSSVATSRKNVSGFQGDHRSGYEDYATSATTSPDATNRQKCTRSDEYHQTAHNTCGNEDCSAKMNTKKISGGCEDEEDHPRKRRHCDEGCGRVSSNTSEQSVAPCRGRVPPNSVRNINIGYHTNGNELRKRQMRHAGPDDCDCTTTNKANIRTAENMYGPCVNSNSSESEEDDRRTRTTRCKSNKQYSAGRNKSRYADNTKGYMRSGKKDFYCDPSNCQDRNVDDDMDLYPSYHAQEDCGGEVTGQVNNGSKLTVKEIIVCALRCEIMGFVMESLSLYEECIRRLRKKLASEELPEPKAREIRQYLRNYESHAQRLRRQIQRRLFDSKLIEQIDIADNSNGNSYEKLFGKYMDDKVTEAHIYEPYMTDHCHFRNLISFLELLVKRCPNIRYIRLSTQKDVASDSAQKETLRDICDQMENVNVAFNFRYDENLLDHKIILSNGVIIDMTRGLHYFKPWNGEYALGLCDYDFRRCCRTKIEIWLTTPFADDCNLNRNGQACDCDSSEKLDRDYFPD